MKIVRSVDTPTICNAIEVVQGKRGFSGYTRGTVLCCDPALPAMCGYAKTARIAAQRPSQDPPEQIRHRRLAYYRHMAAGPGPSIAVVEDIDYPDCVGAFWGEINTTVHSGLGLQGALTNGVMRDLGDLAKDFQVVAGSIGPSHAFVHVVDIGNPVNVFGLQIANGDLVHADRHGAVVIPNDVVPLLEDAIGKLQSTERLILEPARGPGFTIEKFEEAWRAFEAART
ncbi:RraA family protein [Rhizobium sp. BK176]|uniref:RraA family protein n=1 Tax=Rhizobium sp. BK176 TaxID=2587071 RepID=UPI0021691979|nr:RraA family protein [Rhizobium sp. BK176]